MHSPSQEKTAVALSSVFAAVALTGSKLGVGLMTGSLGLLSEAAHSALDLVAALITWLAVRFSDRPADAEHNYGHGKIENLSALFETLLLLATCLWIIYEAVRRLFFQEVHVESSAWGFVVILFSIAVDWSRSRALMRVAKKHHSQALEADALHFSTDIWSSLVVLFGLGMVWLGNHTQRPSLAKADAIAALVVAGIVIWISLKLGRRTIDDLLDRAPPELAEQVRAAAAVPGVEKVERVRLRKSGAQTFVDVTLIVPRQTPLPVSHRLANEAETAIASALPGADVVVHVEPAGETPSAILKTIHALAARHALRAHAIAVSDPQRERALAMHLEVGDHLSVEAAHQQASAFERDLRAALPQFQSVITHIEPRHAHGASPQPGADLTEAELEKALRQLIAAEGLSLQPHDLQLHRAGASLSLSFHLACDGATQIGAAHDLTTRLENRLRRCFPQLSQIVIHVEPWEQEKANV